MCRSISILVRSRNDEAFAEATLRAVFAQDCGLPFEVICCDDASTDRTPEIIASFDKVRVLPRPEGVYIPGRRLNYMVSAASGDIVVFNNADATPCSPRWLSELVAPLVSGKADAVYGNQLPRPDAEYLVRKDYERAFGDGTAASGWRFFFSLATAAVRREELTAHPFNETISYSEDVEWARRRPIRIAYAAKAMVEHSHNYTFAELKKRFFGEGFADAFIFGDRPRLFRELASGAVETVRDAFFLFSRPRGLKELPKAPLRRFIQKFYHWKGVRAYVRQHPSA